MNALKPANILNGVTFPYIDVFGISSGIALGIELGDEQYFIYDRYCMNPRCKCENVILQFVEDSENVVFTVLLRLKNKKYSIMNTSGISNKQAYEIVKHTLRDSVDRDEAIELFKKRYKEMKAAGATALTGSKKTDEVVQEMPKRNAPCPCGSGKKYKKCCGA